MYYTISYLSVIYQKQGGLGEIVPEMMSGRWYTNYILYMHIHY